MSREEHIAQIATDVMDKLPQEFDLPKIKRAIGLDISPTTVVMLQVRGQRVTLRLLCCMSEVRGLHYGCYTAGQRSEGYTTVICCRSEVRGLQHGVMVQVRDQRVIPRLYAVGQRSEDYNTVLWCRSEIRELYHGYKLHVRGQRVTLRLLCYRSEVRGLHHSYMWCRSEVRGQSHTTVEGNSGETHFLGTATVFLA